MKQKLIFSFYLKKEKSKNNGEAPIYCKIKLGDSSCTISTGKYIQEHRWKESNKLKNTVKNQNELNTKGYINQLPYLIDQHYSILLAQKNNIKAIDIKNSYLGKVEKKKETSFNDVIDYHLQHFNKRIEKGEVCENTKYKYVRIAKLFNEFLDLKLKCDNIELKKINPTIIYEFDNYLRYEKEHINGIGLINNTVVKYFKMLKAIFNYATKRNFIENNPFNIYDEKLNEVETIFLNEVELKKLENVKLDNIKLNSVRDIFLFTCYTGYAPVDAMRLKQSDITIDEDGTKWIRTRRQKTGVKEDVPLTTKVIKILEKYKDDIRCIDDNRLLPRYSNQKLNKYIKEVGELANINHRLSWYVARHTFATNSLNNGVGLEVVSKLMGHKKTTQTQHYAKLLDKTVKEAFMKIFD